MLLNFKRYFADVILSTRKYLLFEIFFGDNLGSYYILLLTLIQRKMDVALMKLIRDPTKLHSDEWNNNNNGDGSTKKRRRAEKQLRCR